MDKADRFNSGKPKWSLVDFLSLEPLVRVLEYGAKKYSPDNWKKGSPILEICDSLFRHLIAFKEGEDNDQESGLSHLGHIFANTMFLSYVMKNKKQEFDNRREEVIKDSTTKVKVTLSRVYEFDINRIESLLKKEEVEINEETIKEKAEEISKDYWYEEVDTFLDNIDDFVSAKVEIYNNKNNNKNEKI